MDGCLRSFYRELSSKVFSKTLARRNVLFESKRLFVFLDEYVRVSSTLRSIGFVTPYFVFWNTKKYLFSFNS